MFDGLKVAVRRSKFDNPASWDLREERLGSLTDVEILTVFIALECYFMRCFWDLL